MKFTEYVDNALPADERIAEAGKHFNLIFSAAPTGKFSYLWVKKETVDDTGKKSFTKKTYPFDVSTADNRLEMARRAIELNDKGFDVYVGLNLTDNPVDSFSRAKAAPPKKAKDIEAVKAGAKWEVITYQTVLVTDIDTEGGNHISNAEKKYAPNFDAAKSFLPFDVSFTVNSGYGFHGYILLDSPLAINDDSRNESKERNEKFIKAVRMKAGDCEIDSVFDLARILRVAGTRNYKLGISDNAPMCRLVDVTDCRLSLADVDEKLNAVLPPDVDNIFNTSQRKIPPPKANEGTQNCKLVYACEDIADRVKTEAGRCKVKHSPAFGEKLKRAIKLIPPDELINRGYLQAANSGYVCPNPSCRDGSGEDGTGVTYYSDSGNFFCGKCNHNYDVIDVLAFNYGLDSKKDFNQILARAREDFQNFLATVDFNALPIKTNEREKTSAEQLKFINEDLNSSVDDLKNFVDDLGGTWRGLPFDILNRFHCRFIKNWVSPKNRVEKKSVTATPRVIIPSCVDGEHSNYFSRLAYPVDTFDKAVQKFLDDTKKQNAGHPTLFNPDALTSNEFVFCTEGAIDAMSIEFAGFPCVALGGKDFHEQLLEVVAPMKDKPRIIILLDCDDDGRKAAPELQRKLIAAGCPAIVRFLSGDVSKIDANEILQEHGVDYLGNELFAIACDTNTNEEFEAVEEKISLAETVIEVDTREIFKGDGSDLSNGKSIALFGRNKFRWLEDDENWLAYENGIWRRRSEKNSVIAPYVMEMAELLDSKALTVKDVAIARIFTKRKKIDAAMFFVKGCREILITADDLNRNKNLIAVKNCVIDLQTGKTYRHSPDYLITNQADADYNPKVDTSFVKKFFHSVLPDEETLRGVLRFLGYALTGEKNYHISQFWRGSGANGKSSILDAVNNLFGTYCVKMPAAALLESRTPPDGDKPTPALCMLDGDKRLALVDEMPPHSRLEAALFKTITGDEKVYARPMYKNPRNIELRAKLILSGNHLPQFDVDDGGLQRRINNVEYTQKFEGDKADVDLPKKLATPENRSALMKILVDEAQEFYRSGLIESAAMKEAKEKYFSESDFIAEFISERCIVGDGGEVSRKTLEEKICEAYPRETRKLKKRELLNFLLKRLEPLGAAYMQDRFRRNVFKNLKLVDAE